MAVVSLGSAAPAGAATLQQQRSSVQQKRVQVLGQINVLKATDGQLTRAVSALDSAVSAQLNLAEEALAAVKVALARQAADDAAVRATEAHVRALRGQVVAKAVQQYMQPGGNVPLLAGSVNLSQLGQRTMFLQEVAGRGADVLDELRAARMDLQFEQRAAARARAEADSRQRAQNNALNQLEQARSVKQKLQSALIARISAYQGEASSLAAQEGTLEGFIRAQEAAANITPRFTASGVSSEGLIWPVSGPITSPFGPRYGGFHPGIDIGVPTGTPIHAAKAGVIIYASWMGGYGNVIIIDHGGGFSTLYAHQSRLITSVGQVVSQGQVIGYSGSTGYSTGPHLHFETRVNSIPQNPIRYLP